MPTPVRRYTWQPSKPDNRDHMFGLGSQQLPEVVEALAGANPVEDQGKLASCTGHAGTTALEIVTSSGNLSRLMAYYNARVLGGNVNRDSGATIRDLIKGFTKFGVAREAVWPYNPAKFSIKPSIVAEQDAKRIVARVSSYERLTSLIQIQVALANGLPVIFGFRVPDYFEGQFVAKTGWVPFPAQPTRFVGGHAVCAVGYNTRHPVPYVQVRNSWGTSWGKKGDFAMPFEWFEKIDQPGGLVSDCWVIHPK